MKLSLFLKEKSLFLILNTLAAAFCAVMLSSFGAGLYFALFIPSIVIIGAGISIFPEFIQKRRFYDELESSLEQLDKRHLLCEVIERPDFLEGQILFDTIAAAAGSMNDEIAKYKNATVEYREYIELWVHEVKTPIAAAKLMAGNAMDEALEDEVDKIDGYVNQALFYARSSIVEKDWSIRRVKLSALVGASVKANARFLISRSVSISTENLDSDVFADTKWMVFIISQLIGNSVKYGSKKLEFIGMEKSGYSSLVIKDDGIGIPEKDIDRVFEKGFTGENGREFGRSTGLGLYLCKKLCHKLGLDIRVKASLYNGLENGLENGSENGSDNGAEHGTEMEIVFPKDDMAV
ncbi:MAG: sensor histidine kinase [Clostridiales bacterium]|jgi:signal transduction histidine kinase|nr:sensor histidine kinase [Clostridiales bacterium]